MNNPELLSHIIDIKERLSAIEAKVEAHNNFDGRVQRLEKNVESLSTSHKMYKWVIGLCVAIAVGILKTLKN